MNQHVAGATHKQGNILDVVITPNHDNLIKSVTVCDYNISDHYSVECNMDLLVSHPKTRFTMKRSLNNIGMDVFIADLCTVNDRLLSKNSDDTNEIVCTFNTSLRKLLDKHALLKKIRIRTKPRPWYDQEVENARVYRRVCENLWRLTGLNLTRTLYTTSRNYVNKLVNRKNTVFYKNKLQNAHNKQMFTIVKSLKGPKYNNISYFSSMKKGCTRFSEYFTNKIRLLLSKIESAQHTIGAETQLYTETLSSFTKTNTMHVLELLLKSTKKTCELDPLPSSVLNECFMCYPPSLPR